MYDSPIMLWDAKGGVAHEHPEPMKHRRLMKDYPDDIVEKRTPIRLSYLGGNRYDAITKEEDREQLLKSASKKKVAKKRIIQKHRREGRKQGGPGGVAGGAAGAGVRGSGVSANVNLNRYDIIVDEVMRTRAVIGGDINKISIDINRLVIKSARHARAAESGTHPLLFAVAHENEPHDKAAMQLVIWCRGLNAIIDVNVNCTNTLGETPLWIACNYGHEQDVVLLLRHPSIEVNWVKPGCGTTPLIIAANRGRPDVVKLLLANSRVDPNRTSTDGNTALTAAANKGRDRCVEALFNDPRVEVNRVESNGRTPLFLAAAFGHIRCVELCLSQHRARRNSRARVDPNLVDSNGCTPLWIAIEQGHHSCVELLLADRRVEVFTRGVDNGFGGYTTPLDIACFVITHSVGTVGTLNGDDPARSLVLLLQSRRVPRQNMAETAVSLRRAMPSDRAVELSEAGGTPLTAEQHTARLVLPVLLAQLKGEFRWCAHCLKLTPDVDLNRCGGCYQVGYCEESCVARDSIYALVVSAASPVSVAARQNAVGFIARAANTLYRGVPRPVSYRSPTHEC